eukprot:IDg13223t1
MQLAARCAQPVGGRLSQHSPSAVAVLSFSTAFSHSPSEWKTNEREYFHSFLIYECRSPCSNSARVHQCVTAIALHGFAGFLAFVKHSELLASKAPPGHTCSFPVVTLKDCAMK